MPLYFNSVDRFNRKNGKLTTFFCFLLVSRSSQAPQSQRSTLRRPLLEHLLLLLSLLVLQQLQHRLLILNLALALALLLSLRRSRSKKVFTVTTKSTSSKNEMMHALLSRPPRRQSPRRVSYISAEHELTCRSNEKTT
jgi:hypothetical protein